MEATLSPSSSPSWSWTGDTCRIWARSSAPFFSAQLLLLPFHIQDPDGEVRRKTSLEPRLDAHTSIWGGQRTEWVRAHISLWFHFRGVQETKTMCLSSVSPPQLWSDLLHWIEPGRGGYLPPLIGHLLWKSRLCAPPLVYPQTGSWGGQVLSPELHAPVERETDRWVCCTRTQRFISQLMFLCLKPEQHLLQKIYPAQQPRLPMLHIHPGWSLPPACERQKYKSEKHNVGCPGLVFCIKTYLQYS